MAGSTGVTSKATERKGIKGEKMGGRDRREGERGRGKAK